MLTWKDRILGSFKRHRRIIILLTVLVVVIIFSGWAFIAGKFSYNISKQKEEIVSKCGEIESKEITDKAVPDHTFQFSAPLSGNYSKTEAICQWYVDGTQVDKNSIALEGRCLSPVIPFNTEGEKIVSYKAKGLKGCPKETKVTITLTEKQKEEALKLKQTGMTQEDLDLINKNR
jgi:hypothetical protein